MATNDTTWDNTQEVSLANGNAFERLQDYYLCKTFNK